MSSRHKHLKNPTGSLTGFGRTLTFWDPPAQPVDTSLAAAAQIKGHTARIRQAIYLWLRTQGTHGGTEREISAALSLNSSTTRPRLRELEGDAPWAKGKVPRLVARTEARREHMRVYVAI